MVKFGKFIEANKKEEWKNNYISYNKLKELIDELTLKRDEQEKKDQDYFTNVTNKSKPKSEDKESDNLNIEEDKSNPLLSKTKVIKKSSSISINKHNSSISKKKTSKEDYNTILESTLGEYIKEFTSQLDNEIKKFFKFYKELEKRLYNDVYKNLKTTTYSDLTLLEIFKELHNIEELCSFLLEVCEFINLNVTGVRKILKKFDKKFELQYNPIALFYLGNALENSDSGLLYILKFKCIDDSSAIIERLLNDLDYLKDKQFSLIQEKNKIEVDNLRHSTPYTLTKNNKNDYNFSNSNNNIRKTGQFKDIDNALEEPFLIKELKIEDLKLDKTDLLKSKITEKIYNLKKQLEKVDESNDMIRNSVENWTLIIQNNLRMISDKDAEFKLWKQKETKLANNEIIIKNLTPQIQEILVEEKPHHSIFNIWVCLIHTCVNSLNSTIVFPTNSRYIESIGASSFLTGIVIASTHFAAIGFTFLYSNWTNSSYRSPLLFSIVAYFFGNIFYSYSGYFESIYPMIIGRFLIGVGSARVINRRYLIDHVEEAHLLHYSLLYVILTCIGHVLGPLLAVFILLLKDYSFLNGIIVFNMFTWPAWVCSLVWVVGLFVVYVYFKDPENLKNKGESGINNNQEEYEELTKVNKEINTNQNNEEEEFTFQKLNSFAPLKQETFKVSNIEEFNKALNTSTDEKYFNNNNTSLNSNNKGNHFRDNIQLVERDIKEIIKDQETNFFSYMSVAFTILLFTLFIIRVRYIFNNTFIIIYFRWFQRV